MTQPPPPQYPDAALSARRIYFEQLAAAMLAKGVPGERIGDLVAELDDHVAMIGADPVTELGPVGALAGALAESVAGRHPWRWHVGHAVFAISVGTVLVAAAALLFGRLDGGKVAMYPGIGIYLTVFTSGLLLVRGFGGAKLLGKSRFELPSLKLFVPFILVVAVISVATQEWRFVVSTGVAVATLFVALPVLGGMALWSLRQSRIPIPGRVRHLRRLEWGVFGR